MAPHCCECFSIFHLKLEIFKLFSFITKHQEQEQLFPPDYIHKIRIFSKSVKEDSFRGKVILKVNFKYLQFTDHKFSVA